MCSSSPSLKAREPGQPMVQVLVQKPADSRTKKGWYFSLEFESWKRPTTSQAVGQEEFPPFPI